MSGIGTFAMGSQAVCHDGPCGRLRRVVVDPLTKAVTHLVVEPKRYPGFGRLVPVELVRAEEHRIHLDCTRAEFENLESAEETQFPPPVVFDGFTREQVLAWPYYSLSGTVLGDEGDFGAELAHTVVRDSLPAGEVDVRRGDCVHATDGDIGRVQGLVVDPESHRVTDILLQQGHLWGRKQVAIPVAAVRSIKAGIQLNISKRQVTQLTQAVPDHRAAPAGTGSAPKLGALQASEGARTRPEAAQAPPGR